MRNAVIILIGVVALVAGILLTKFSNNPQAPAPNIPLQSSSPVTSDNPQITIISQNLDTPWAIAFLPDGSMLVTERKGTVKLVDAKGNLQSDPIATITSAREVGEGGLLGIALHPDFTNNNFVYLYYTYSSEGDDTLNGVVRMTYKDNTLKDEEIIVDNIPGASNHNGGRIKFGPDKNLYITTGDAQEPSRAQDTKSLAGKILRVNTEGKVEVHSYGHRNPQGLAWESNGNLWATEHGSSAFDELNLIEQGKNYGWAEIRGDEIKEGMVTPVKNSGSTTWAPAGAAIVGNSMFFGGLRGQTLYEAIIQGNQISEVKEHFKNEFGRIREVILGPDNMLYITTSNRDGRGTPEASDDKIIRINPEKL